MLKKVVLLLALCCFVGCASQKMWYGDTKTGIRLRHQFATGDSTFYLIESTTLDSMKLMGKMNTSKTIVNCRFSHQILSKLSSEDEFQTLLKLDSLHLESNQPDLEPILLTFEDAIKSFLNKKMLARVSRLGKVSVHSPIDSLIPPRLLPFINPQHKIGLFYPTFSNQKVKPNEKWQATTRFKRQTPDLKVKVSSQTENYIEKFVPGDSTELAQIKLSGDYQIDGEGRKLNIMARIEGTGTIEGSYIFDFQKGQFLEGTFVERLQYKYFFPGVESMPVIQKTHIQTRISTQ